MRLPIAIKQSLGVDPVARLVALLEIANAVGDRAPEALRRNPFLDVALDSEKRFFPFEGSTLPTLRNSTATEAGLLTRAAELSGLTVTTLAKIGLLREVKRVIVDFSSRTTATRDASGTGAESDSVSRTQRTTEIYLAAMRHIFTKETYITPTRLMTVALSDTFRGDFRSADRFLTARAADLGLTSLTVGQGRRWIPVDLETTRALLAEKR